MATSKKARQQVFDTVLAHLRKQGAPAIHDGGCVYRAENGNRCAIGCLIADTDYDPLMEHKSADNARVFAVLPDFAKKSGGPFLARVQMRLHDNLDHYSGRDRFLAALEDAAEHLATVEHLSYTSAA